MEGTTDVEATSASGSDVRSGKQRIQDDTRSPGCLERVNRAINGTIERVFDQLGRFIGRWPIVAIIAAVIVAIILGTGVLQLENENRGDKLWVPKGTQSESDGDVVEALFPPPGRFQSWRLQREDRSNILTPAAFNAAFAIRNGSQAVVWNNTDGVTLPLNQENLSWPYTSVCLPTNENERFVADKIDCWQSDILAIFDYNQSNWATTDAILARINAPDTWERGVVGPGFQLSGAISGETTDSDGAVTAAETLTFTFFLVGNTTLAELQEDDPTVVGWEQEWLNFMEGEDERLAEYTVARLAARSFDDEFGSTIDGDLALLQAAIIAIALFTIIAITDCRDGCVGSRVLLSAAGLANIGLAVVAAYGFGGYIGLLFSPLMSILPFIMIGIGVDGMFVLQAALDKTDRRAPLVDRMGYTLSHAGVSVTVASITNVAAFLIGSNTSLPALSAFSIYAALGILFDLLLQITFFAGIMALDAKRQTARRLDVICCFKDPRPENSGACCGLISGRPKKRPSTHLMEALAKVLATTPAKIVVIALWIAAVAVGIAGAAQISVEGDVNNFIPDGSYLKTYLALGNGAIDDGVAVALYFANSEGDAPFVDFSDPAVGEQMLAAIETIEGSEFTKPGSFDAWYPAFLASLGGAAPQASFFADLEEFLASADGERYAFDVVFVNENNTAAGLEAHRFNYEWVFFTNNVDQVDALHDSRDLVDAFPEPLRSVAFVYGADFLNIEQYALIGKEAFTNIALAFAMIAVIVIFLLASPIGSIITFLCVASAIIELIGIMHFIGFGIDSVVVIFLVISLGLAVDYSVHVAHGFLAAREPTTAERLRTTLVDTGAPVINGATSTLIAALFLAASGSYVFETFFYALLVVVLAGAFQGLVVLPVLMSIFAPPPHVAVLGETQVLRGDAGDSVPVAKPVPASPVAHV